VTKDDSDVTLKTNMSSVSLMGNDGGNVGILREESEKKQSFCERHSIEAKEKPSTTTGNTMKSKLKGVVRAQILANSLGNSNRTNAEVQHSRKNDALLDEMFPPHIVDALREGRRVPQEKHECVTIFFSDVVGFSAMSRALSPEKVADLLDRLYTRFDELTRLHDIFKIETIGDAFMAAANLVKDQSVSHARRIAEFSIDAIKVANTTQIDRDDPSKGCVEIRVGFHSGPVTSGVVGTRLPKYGIFGDSVNIASRMESHSEPNHIHVSDVSARLLKKQAPGMAIVPRDTIDVKGIGQMNTYWVNRDSVQGSSGLDFSDPSNSANAVKPRGRHQNPEGQGRDDDTYSDQYRASRSASPGEHRNREGRHRSRGQSSSSSSPHHSSKSRSRSMSGHGGRRTIGTNQVSGKLRYESSLGDEAMHKKPAELKSRADPRSRRESSFASGPMFRSSVAISLSEPIFPDNEMDDKKGADERGHSKNAPPMDEEESQLRQANSDPSLQNDYGTRQARSDAKQSDLDDLPRLPPRSSEISRFSGLTKDSSFRSCETRPSIYSAIRRGRETALTPSRELSRHDSYRLSKLEQEGRELNIDGKKQRLQKIKEIERKVSASGCGDIAHMEEKGAGDECVTSQRFHVPSESIPSDHIIEANPLGMHIREFSTKNRSRRSNRASSAERSSLRNESALNQALKASKRQMEKDRHHHH